MWTDMKHNLIIVKSFKNILIIRNMVAWTTLTGNRDIVDSKMHKKNANTSGKLD